MIAFQRSLREIVRALEVQRRHDDMIWPFKIVFPQFRETQVFVVVQGYLEQFLRLNPHRAFLFFDTRRLRVRHLPFRSQIGFRQTVAIKIAGKCRWNLQRSRKVSSANCTIAGPTATSRQAFGSVAHNSSMANNPLDTHASAIPTNRTIERFSSGICNWRIIPAIMRCCRILHRGFVW